MAEFTEDQLRQAARRAYDDGNIEAAQRLIAQARAAGGLREQQPQGGSSVNQENLNTVSQAAENTMTGLANGVTLGFGENIAAGIGGVDSMVRGNGFRRGYDSTLQLVRDGIDEARRENPTETGLGEVLGASFPALASAPLATGKTALGTAIRGSGIGATEGAVFGAGNADGENVGQEALEGAVIGGTVGLVAPAAIAGAQGLRRRIVDPVAGAFGVGNQRRAENVIERAVTRSGRTLEDIQQDALEAGRSGLPEFAIMDMLGSPGQGAASGVARTPGEASAELREFLQSRQLDAGDRMSAALADSLGATDTAAQRQASLAATRAADADVNYAAARQGAQPVDVRGALQVLDTRLGQTAGMEGTGFSGDGIDGVFSQFRNRLAADRVPSDVDAIELSDFDRVLGVKQDMQDAIGAATRAGRNNEARELGRVVAQLDQALEAASPNYRTANDTFRAQSQAIDAVDAGANAARPSVRADDAIDQFRGMSANEQDSFRAGLANQLIGRIEGQAPGANVASPLMRTRTDRLLEEVAQDPSRLRGQIARENTMAETRQRAVGGSRTADNLADMDDTQAVDVGILANLMQMNFGQAGVQLGQRAANAASGRNEATNQAIARMLMSNDPASVLTPIMQRQSAQQGRNRIAEALLRNAIVRPTQ